MRGLFIVLSLVVVYRSVIELTLFYIHLETVIYKSIQALRKIGTLFVAGYFLVAL